MTTHPTEHGRRTRWTVLAAVAVLAAVLLPVLGRAEAQVPRPDQRPGQGEAIYGSWRVLATATAPVAGTAHVLLTVVPGGGLVETRLLAHRPIPGVVDVATLETPGHGNWTVTGPRRFSIMYLYFIQTADGGDLLATETVRWDATLGRDGTLSGPATSEVHLADGTLAVAWSFTAAGQKIS